MDDQRLSVYLNDVQMRLAAEGFAAWPDSPIADGSVRVFHRRKAQLTKFAMVDTVVAVTANDGATAQDFVSYSSDVFGAALSKKHWLPRGLGAMIVAHAVVVTTKANPGVVAEAQSYAPKHWAATEFPALVELESNDLHYFGGTPMWGAAYFRGFRETAERLFGPR